MVTREGLRTREILHTAELQVVYRVVLILWLTQKPLILSALNLM